MTTAVFGIGNAVRGDDAVGLEVVRLLDGNVGDDVRLRTWEGEPVGLIEEWRGCDRVVLVDAMRTGVAPGTVRTIDARSEPLPAELSQPSTHLVGVGEAVELARTLGRLPARVDVYAIEGGSFDAGAPLSPPVAAAAAFVAAAIHNELTRA